MHESAEIKVILSSSQRVGSTVMPSAAVADHGRHVVELAVRACVRLRGCWASGAGRSVSWPGRTEPCRSTTPAGSPGVPVVFHRRLFGTLLSPVPFHRIVLLLPAGWFTNLHVEEED